MRARKPTPTAADHKEGNMPRAGDRQGREAVRSAAGVAMQLEAGGLEQRPVQSYDALTGPNASFMSGGPKGANAPAIFGTSSSMEGLDDCDGCTTHSGSRMRSDATGLRGQVFCRRQHRQR